MLVRAEVAMKFLSKAIIDKQSSFFGLTSEGIGAHGKNRSEMK